MKQIVIDFTSAGFWPAVKHFLLGIVLYAAIGGLQYTVQRLANYHPGTPESAAILVVISEGIQALSRWLTTAKSVVDTQDINVPQGAPLA